MAVGVVGVPRVQQQKDDSLSKLLTIGGAAAGGYFGGPAGIATGASLGGLAGGMLTPKELPQQEPGPIETGGDAMSRRMQALQESPYGQIRESIDSLKYIQDPQQREMLAKPLLQADFMARNKGVV